MVIKVGINGFGRIGRVVFRACLRHSDIEIAAINDPAVEVQYICYLIRFDSTHGKLSGNITHTEDEIQFNDNVIKVFHQKLPSSIPWNSVGVQYVIEASGMFTNLEKASGHLASDAVKRVIVTAPSVDVPMVILGVNESTLSAEPKIISCGSSTLYCLAPIVKILEDNFGVADGFITSIHAMTPSLKPLDGLCLRGKVKHWRDHRSIHQNIIPATTGACKALGKILPALRDKMTGLAFRVPIVNVSVLDLTIRLNKNTTLPEIVKIVDKMSKSSSMQNIIKTSNEETVSSDYAADSHSCILDVQSSLQLKSNFFKLICWYENEHSYACRVIDSIVFSETQMSGPKTKITHVGPQLSKKEDMVQQTECCVKEMFQEKQVVTNYKTQIQNTDLNIKLQPRSVTLKQPINSRNSSGVSYPTRNSREPKKKTELFKIWHDERDKFKPSIQQNRNPFFHNVNAYPLQNTNQADCIKAQERLENVKMEFSKMLIITEDLLKKSQNSKLNLNESSAEGVAVNINYKKDNKNEPKNTYKVLEKLHDLQICSAVFDVNGDDTKNNSKMLSDRSTENTIYNSVKKDYLEQSNHKVLNFINDEQNTGQKFETPQNDYNLKNNVTKTFNSLLDGITKNLQFQNSSGDRNDIKMSQEKAIYEKHENQINTNSNFRTDCTVVKSFDEINTIKKLFTNKDKGYETCKGVHTDRKPEHEKNTFDGKIIDIKRIVREPKKNILTEDKNNHNEGKRNKKATEHKEFNKWDKILNNTYNTTTLTKEIKMNEYTNESTTAYDRNNNKKNTEKIKTNIFHKWEDKIKKLDSFFISPKDNEINECKVIHNEDTPSGGKSNVIKMLTKWEHRSKSADNSLTITHANLSMYKKKNVDEGKLNHEKSKNKLLTKWQDKVKTTNRPLSATNEKIDSEEKIFADEQKHSYDNRTTNRKSRLIKWNGMCTGSPLPITTENVLGNEKKISVDEDKQNKENTKNKTYFISEPTDTENASTLLKLDISDKSEVVHKEKINDKPIGNEDIIKWEDTTQKAEHILIPKQTVINDLEKISVKDMKQNDGLSKTINLANTINNTHIITPKKTKVIITKTDKITNSKEILNFKTRNSPIYEDNNSSTIIPTKAYQNYEINFDEEIRNLENKSKNNENHLDLIKGNIKCENLPTLDFKKVQNVTCDENINAEAEKIKHYNYDNTTNISNRVLNCSDTNALLEEVKKRVIIIVDDHTDGADAESTCIKEVFETEKLRVETYNSSIKNMDLRKLVSKNFNEFNSEPIVIMTENNTNKFKPRIKGSVLSNEKRIYIEDIYDKLDSASDTDSENSIKIGGRKSQVIRITDLTGSLEDLDRLDKICRIIEISDELSDKLFAPLDNTATTSHTTNKKWSFKALCEKINLDEFCEHVFSGQPTDETVIDF